MQTHQMHYKAEFNNFEVGLQSLPAISLQSHIIEAAPPGLLANHELRPGLYIPFHDHSM